MITITEALTAEHGVFCALFDHIESLLPGLRRLAEVKILAGLVEGLLLSHGAAEEDLVLVALDRVLPRRGRCEQFYQQHQEIDVRLRQAQTTEGLTHARHLLQTAVLASREHFRHEERFIFPLVERVMSRMQTRKLGLLRIRQRGRLGRYLVRQSARRP
jgi:hypothetical protein